MKNEHPKFWFTPTGWAALVLIAAATGSPYSSPSCNALNPSFLDGQDLADEGFARHSPKDFGLPSNGETQEYLCRCFA